MLSISARFYLLNQSKKEREFDIIVLGASGFAGQFVIEELARTLINQQIKWAVSGRNFRKLDTALIKATIETGIYLRRKTKIKIDINDAKSLNGMTGRTKILLNCVGPYELYGEQVIR